MLRNSGCAAFGKDLWQFSNIQWLRYHFSKAWKGLAASFENRCAECYVEKSSIFRNCLVLFANLTARLSCHALSEHGLLLVWATKGLINASYAVNIQRVMLLFLHTIFVENFFPFWALTIVCLIYSFRKCRVDKTDTNSYNQANGFPLKDLTLKKSSILMNEPRGNSNLTWLMWVGFNTVPTQVYRNSQPVQTFERSL